MKGLMGDSSDNIPGVPGVGERRRSSFETVPYSRGAAVVNRRSQRKKLKEKLEEFKEQALMSKELATITTEAPLEVSLDSLGYEGLTGKRSSRF
ncbi:5'-3' exonuclease H3TH domain-containing protein [Bacillus licheniformis]|nr:5'-3' exonuclease H3TH domain-containing protein [Bacillus licheniformis]